ncbi:glycosyltransferase family 2 protein [Arthrobacter sp. W4I7]|uniref:glycosyltransferase family 2 protein n=1 Tax=Arthrobacter sp. W4I7 TaxID=3042296 RepID=UPI002781DE76|nr:glycosyltransferase family 2 protein [Arthrobacter sp. W4I7]MDQ0690382.1 glycosyltransferase involved in cell wall biosynthesis [Arthrobacter sp. W4I7]
MTVVRNNARFPAATKVLVIMPAWNERDCIGNTVHEVIDLGRNYNVLVVDDGSDDGTPELAEAAGAHVLRLPFNLGVGGAMRAGFKYAHRMGYDAVVQVDADGQHDPRDIPSVVEGLAYSDISIGARFADKGQYSVRGPRKWAMRLLAAVISRMAGTELTDVTSGFRAGNTHAIAQYLKHYPAEYLGDTIDSLVVAIRSGCIVSQTGVEMRPRQGGQPSHNPAKSAIYLVRSLMALFFAMTRGKAPSSHESDF